jgi:nucleotide-binding universal stress UspA family protein
MTNDQEQMHIVCAARGGRRIQPSVNRAIELACEHDARLTFLYVLDVEFLKFTTVGHTGMVFDELDKMGEFMMIRLCEYATEAGCVAPDYVIRHGEIRPEILNYLREAQPNLLVLGRPRDASAEEAPPAFEDEGISHFAEEIERQTGVQVELV